MKLLYEAETYLILGACYEVYKSIGSGFLEAVYQECLAIEFQRKNIPHQSQKPIRLTYKDYSLKQTYISDFMCFDKIIIEIKACKNLKDEHLAQLLNYQKATGVRLGMLINFGHFPKLEHRRLIL